MAPLLVQTVYAADLALPPAPVLTDPDAQFEYGTGWYLRGDASYAEESALKGDSVFGRLNRNWTWAAGGGIGYRLTDMFRLDVTGDFIEPSDIRHEASSGGVTTIAKATVRHYDGLVNAYVDLGNWGGLVPYIGGGIGVGVIDPSSKAVITDTGTGARNVHTVAYDDQTNLAWAAMAGVSYAIDPNIAVDLGYRHLDLGRYSMNVAGYTIKQDVVRDEVRLGVRYMLN